MERPQGKGDFSVFVPFPGASLVQSRWDFKEGINQAPVGRQQSCSCPHFRVSPTSLQYLLQCSRLSHSCLFWAEMFTVGLTLTAAALQVTGKGISSTSSCRSQDPVEHHHADILNIVLSPAEDSDQPRGATLSWV